MGILSDAAWDEVDRLMLEITPLRAKVAALEAENAKLIKAKLTADMRVIGLTPLKMSESRLGAQKLQRPRSSGCGGCAGLLQMGVRRRLMRTIDDPVNQTGTI